MQLPLPAAFLPALAVGVDIAASGVIGYENPDAWNGSGVGSETLIVGC